MAYRTDPTTRAEIAAALAISPDRITELNTLAAALGTGPRTVELRHADTGIPWDDGTVVFRGTSTGPNEIAAGKLRPGRITTNGVVAAKNMDTGLAVIRVFNESGRWSEGPLLVGGSSGFRIPASPSDVFSMVMGDDFGFAADPTLAPAPDIQLATNILHNETAGVQAANFSAPLFGQWFAPGDIPAGSFPHFKTSGGLDCPVTLGGITSWPDGSMKFCRVLADIPAAVPATSTLTLQVRSGGTAPAAGTRTTADLTAPAINALLVGVDGLVGSWTADLNDAIAVGEDVVKLDDGPAGAVWRIGGEVRDSGGVAHMQLYCWWYVIALSNSNGTLRGLRYLGCITQPWADINPTSTPLSGPAPRSRDATVALRNGTTLVRQLQGYLIAPADGGTLQNTIRILHYSGGVYTCGVDGKFDYAQGAGSAAADSVVRVTLDVPYGQRAALLATWDLSVTAGTSPTQDYRPGGKGACQEYAMTSTGERPEIGLLPRFSVQHMIQQDAAWERSTRVTSLCGGAWRYNVRQRLTGSRQITAVTSVPAGYTGLGTIQTAWRYPSAVTGTINNPSPNVSPWTEDAGHQPAAHYWAYLFTGEPQYLDMQVELAASRVLRNHANPTMQFSLVEPVTSSSLLPGPLGRGVQINSGTIYKGASVYFSASNGYREPAWASRDLAQAAALLPDVAPDGSEVRNYLRDIVEQGRLAILAYRDASTPARRNAGIFSLSYGPEFAGNDSPWMLGFYGWSATHQADILPSSTGTAVRSYFASFWKALESAGRLKLSIGYRSNLWDAQNLTPDITGVKWLRYTAGDSTINFSTVDSFGEFQVASFTAPNANFNNVYAMSPQNGDTASFAHQETGVPYAAWDNLIAYTSGNRVVSVDRIYGCIVNVAAAPAPNPSPAADATHWQDVGVADGSAAWNSRAAYTVGAFVINGGRKYQCILAVAAKPVNTVPASDATHWQDLGTAYVNPYRTQAPDRKTLYLVNVSGRRFQCALTPGGAPLTVVDADFPIPGNFGSSAGLTRSAYVWEANGYGPLIQGMVNYMNAAGEDMAACQATMEIVAGTVNFTGQPKYKTLGSR